MEHYVLGVSGASGITLAVKTLDVLTKLGFFVHLVLSKDALYTAIEELGSEWGTPDKFIAFLKLEQKEKVRIYKNHDFSAPIASGSYKVKGMIIIPCSMATLAAIATGLSDNLLRRSADVTLKERRPLVIVPRESPFSEIHLENMLKLARCGVTIVPPVPGWYTKPKNLDDVENFIVGKVLDVLNIDHDIYPRWGK